MAARGLLYQALGCVMVMAYFCFGADRVAADTARVNELPVASVLAEQPTFTAQRSGRFAVIELKTPHRVLSTSRVHGGQSEKVSYLVNHQSMESVADTAGYQRVLGSSSEDYHRAVAETLGLSPEGMVLMGTAANMNHLAHISRSHQNLRVDAFVTAGVTGNALRAGEPARWEQGTNRGENRGDKSGSSSSYNQTGNQFVPQHGTINTILLINTPLTEGAQARAVITMVEAKSAALAELAVPSKRSPYLATGTGTDQYIVAAPLHNNKQPLESTSPHLKIGELIGRTVFEATKEALRWQNGLEPSSTRNVLWALGRFGLDEESLLERLKPLLSNQHYQLLQDNLQSVVTEPRLAAAAYAYAAVLDRLQYGSISSQLAQEVLKDQSANAAVAVSFKTHRWVEFWESVAVDEADPLSPFIQGLALGWESKWQP